jgi:predicted transcriptional regulator
MRTLIDLKDEDIAELDAEAKREGVSRAALMRQAIAEFLSRRRRAGGDAGFGSWKKASKIAVDGLAYQEKLRREW